MQENINDLCQHSGTKEELIDLLHAMALIHALPASWSWTVTVLMSKDILDLIYVELTLKCRSTHNINNSAEGMPVVMALTKGKQKNKSAWQNLVCTNCQNPGHSHKNCWAKGDRNEEHGPKSNLFGKGPSISQNRWSGPSKGQLNTVPVVVALPVYKHDIETFNLNVPFSTATQSCFIQFE